MSNTVEPPLLVVIVAGPTALLPKNFSVPELAMSIGALPLVMMPPWFTPTLENVRDWPPAMRKLYAGAVELKFQVLTVVLAAENVRLVLLATSKTATPVGPRGTVLGLQLVDRL